MREKHGEKIEHNLPVKPWQITFVSLFTQTLAVLDNFLIPVDKISRFKLENIADC